MSDTELLLKSQGDPEPIRRLEVFTGATRSRSMALALIQSASRPPIGHWWNALTVP
jgi:hypothetical protein